MLALSRFVFASSIVSSSLAAVFNVDVGMDGLSFTPNQVTAQAGDEINFTFRAKNHTLTQSSFANPCTPLDGGGDSGFLAVPPNSTVFPSKLIRVPDATTPLWFYCKQGKHCEAGMVFAINPGSQEKMDAFIQNARNSGGAAGAPAPAPPAGSPAPPAPPASSTDAPAAPAPTPDAPAPAAEPTTSTVAPAAPSDAPVIPSDAPAAPGAPREILVDVGAGGLTFNPDRVTAAVGDKIIFTFKGGNHTVTESTFASPCTPLANGIDSGNFPAAGLTSGFPNYTMTVTDATKAQWFYCKTGTHCRAGMVFSLNAAATGDRTPEAFKAAAMGGIVASGSNSLSSTSTSTGLGPGQTAPGDGASSLVGGASGLLIAASLAALLL